MKMRLLLLALGVSAYSSLTFAAQSNLILSGMNSSESINVTLKIQNAKQVDKIKFNGLDNFQVLGREVSINNSSTDESHNVFSSTLMLAPIKAESSMVYATAWIDGKEVNSNKVSFTVTPKQISDFNAKQKQQALIEKKNIEKAQKAINQQLMAQQKYFDEMSKIMQQQQAEMLKAQKDLFKQFDESF